MASEWVSIKDAAVRLGVSADTIRRRRERGEIAGRKRETAQGYVWEIEVPEAAPKPAAAPVQDVAPADALELVRLREQVAGLERERSELIAQRDAWQSQASKSAEAEAELRRLVLQAQTLAGALPPGGESAGAPVTYSERPQGHGETVARPSIWARLFGRPQGS